mmetsp:Transcript_108777/g.351228  ORF Transcript_108777/g.351228 Transcript_108777/m.351228 type:complete len:596 (-) Transcript_108777:2985-4772(-)
MQCCRSRFPRRCRCRQSGHKRPWSRRRRRGRCCHWRSHWGQCCRWCRHWAAISRTRGLCRDSFGNLGPWHPGPHQLRWWRGRRILLGRGSCTGHLEHRVHCRDLVRVDLGLIQHLIAGHFRHGWVLKSGPGLVEVDLDPSTGRSFRRRHPRHVRNAHHTHAKLLLLGGVGGCRTGTRPLDTLDTLGVVRRVRPRCLFVLVLFLLLLLVVRRGVGSNLFLFCTRAAATRSVLFLVLRPARRPILLFLVLGPAPGPVLLAVLVFRLLLIGIVARRRRVFNFLLVLLLVFSLLLALGIRIAGGCRSRRGCPRRPRTRFRCEGVKCPLQHAPSLLGPVRQPVHELAPGTLRQRDLATFAPDGVIEILRLLRHRRRPCLPLYPEHPWLLDGAENGLVVLGELGSDGALAVQSLKLPEGATARARDQPLAHGQPHDPRKERAAEDPAALPLRPSVRCLGHQLQRHATLAGVEPGPSLAVAVIREARLQQQLTIHRSSDVWRLPSRWLEVHQAISRDVGPASRGCRRRLHEARTTCLRVRRRGGHSDLREEPASRLQSHRSLVQRKLLSRSIWALAAHQPPCPRELCGAVAVGDSSRRGGHA